MIPLTARSSSTSGAGVYCAIFSRHALPFTWILSPFLSPGHRPMNALRTPCTKAYVEHGHHGQQGPTFAVVPSP